MNNLPPITKNLLIINVLCYFGIIVARRYGLDLDSVLGLHFFLASDFKLYQLFTYMFMHANLEHIFFNMFAVWMFGRTLEMVFGSKRFLTYYLVCGIGAGIVKGCISPSGAGMFTICETYEDVVQTIENEFKNK